VKGDIEGEKIIQLSSAADSVLALNGFYNEFILNLYFTNNLLKCLCRQRGCVLLG
jgi:hypothetical protein